MCGACRGLQLALTPDCCCPPPIPHPWAVGLEPRGPGRRQNKPALFPCQGRAGPGPQPRRWWGPRAEQASCWQALSPGQEPHWTFFLQMGTSARWGSSTSWTGGLGQQTQSRELGGEGLHAAAPLYPSAGFLSCFRAGQMSLGKTLILLLFFYVQ